MTEQWKPVLDFEDLYMVSDRGKVKRIGTGRSRTVERILKPSFDRHGYLYFRLSRDGNKKRLQAHRIAGIAFCNPPVNWNDLQINHKNGVKADNRAENLEWVTQSENMCHARDVLGVINQSGEKNGNSKLTSDEVVEIRNKYAIGGITLKTLGEQYGVSLSTISLIVLRKNWKHIQRK